MARLGLGVILALLLLPPRARGDGTIYGCASIATHKVRLITTSPPTSRATETPVSWNQQGPPGPKGDKGDRYVVRVFGTIRALEPVTLPARCGH